MKQFLENYNILIAMTILTSIAIILKCICAIVYQILTKETEQMSATKNKWLCKLYTKFEANYKLQMPMKDLDSFLNVHFLNYRILGISVHTLENFDLFCGFVVLGSMLLGIMGGIYYELPLRWLLVQGVTSGIFILFLGIGEFLFQTRQKKEILKNQLRNYLANTLHPKLASEYLYPAIRKAYLNEYFEEEAAPALESSDTENTQRITPVMKQDMQELIDSLLEETKLNEAIQEKKQELTTVATNEKYRLVEEIIRDYL